MTQRTDIGKTGINVFPSTKKLSVQISLNGLSFSVLDVEAGRLDSAGSYNFSRTLSEEALLAEAQPVLKHFGLTDGAFDQVQLIEQTTRFALVPEELFDPASLPHYLKLNARLEPERWPRYDRIDHARLVNIYLGFPEVEEWFRQQYEWVQLRHSGSVLLDSFLKQPQWDENPHCFARVGERTLELVLIRKQSLLAYNIFSYSTPEDFLYFLLMIMEQAGIDPEDADVHLFGQVDPAHPLYKATYRYVRKLHILDPEYGFVVPEEIPSQILDYTVVSGF